VRFAEGAIDKEKQDGVVQTGVELYYETFWVYEQLIKTKKGKKMGKEWLEFVEKFRQHWMGEVNCVAVL
jgi:hypothetical protein